MHPVQDVRTLPAVRAVPEGAILQPPMPVAGVESAQADVHGSALRQEGLWKLGKGHEKAEQLSSRWAVT